MRALFWATFGAVAIVIALVKSFVEWRYATEWFALGLAALATSRAYDIEATIQSLKEQNHG